jgi:hypothetical protein
MHDSLFAEEERNSRTKQDNNKRAMNKHHRKAFLLKELVSNRGSDEVRHQ